MPQLYDRIGTGYDATRRADSEIVHRLCHLLNAARGTKVIDVACGTGNYTEQLHRRGLEVTGVDISREMLDVAGQKSGAVTWAQADVAQLPFADGTYGGATCVLGVHHFANLPKAFEQVYRVLSRGRFVIFTSTPEQMRTYWLNEYFPIAMATAIGQMPTLGAVCDALRAAGFNHIGAESFLVTPALEDLFLYSGKYAPEIYLNDAVRRGISTFADLATPGEIISGCDALARDMESGRIDQVIEGCSSPCGDYTFVVAEKGTRVSPP